MSATTIYLVRHGSVVGAETRRFIGHLDVPLSPLGEAQIAALQVEFAALEDEGRVSTSEHDARSVVMQTERDAAASRRGADTAASSSGSKQ